MMIYKGYLGVLQVDEEAGVLRGKVINTKDTITFQGETVAEAKAAFHDSVDDYLEFCASLGEPPEKPFSGKLLVRIRPELHRDLSALAQARGVSLNKLISHQLAELARGSEPGTRASAAQCLAPAKLTKTPKSAAPEAASAGRAAAPRRKKKSEPGGVG